MKTKVFSANVNGIFTQIKAFKKVDAVSRFQQLDDSLNDSDVHLLKNAQNSHQLPVEEYYPEICK